MDSILKKRDLVQVGDGEEYYDIGIIEDISNQVYIRTFNQNGSLDRFDSRFDASNLRKISLDRVYQILEGSALRTIKTSIGDLKVQGIIREGNN